MSGFPTFTDAMQHLPEVGSNPMPAAPSPLPPTVPAAPSGALPPQVETDWARADLATLLADGVPEGPLAVMRFAAWRRHMPTYGDLSTDQRRTYNTLSNAAGRARKAMTDGDRRAYEWRNAVRASGGDPAHLDPREFESTADREARLAHHLIDGTDVPPPLDFAGRRDEQAQREREFYAKDKATLADMRRRARAEAGRVSAERRAVEKSAARLARQYPDTPQGRVARATLIALAGERERAKSWGQQAHDDAWAIQLQGRDPPRAIRHTLLTTPLAERRARFNHNKA